MAYSKDGIPVLKGFVGNRQLHVWCSYCQRFHHHGIGHEIENGLPIKRQHRVAHCINPDSPFLKGGYYIQPFTKAESRSINKWMGVDQPIRWGPILQRR